MKLHQSRLAPLCLLLLTAFCGSGQAQSPQDADSPPWYQIEIIVFEHSMLPQSGGDAEVWPRDLLLIYPPNSHYIYSSEDLEIMRQGGENSAETYRNLLAQQRSGELPFVSLGAKAALLAPQLRAIESARDMRVLLHKVWRQPLREREQSPAILVPGGNQYDGRFELQGTLTFSVGRYLHVNADLWLAHFQVNLGQDDSYWPRLPELPEKFPSQNPVGKLVIEELKKSPFSPSKPWQSASAFAQQGADNMGPGPSGAQAQNQYTVRSIVKFEQSRRMRSGELHYLDHPKLGMLVRIDGYRND